jgi:predicted phosphodiesterase
VEAWIEEVGIDIVLHGHKHIPRVFPAVPVDSVCHIGCGSSTGKIKHVERTKTYLSYNLITCDQETSRPSVCTLKYIDVLGSRALVEKNGVYHLLAVRV